MFWVYKYVQTLTNKGKGMKKKYLAQWVSLIFKKQFMSHNIQKGFETTSMYITNLQYHEISIDSMRKP
jgi:hypothetical protein